MTVDQLLDLNDRFFTKLPSSEKVEQWRSISSKAHPHSRPKSKKDTDESFNIPRPHEGDKSVEWRNNNYRQFTMSLFQRFTLKSSRSLLLVRPDKRSEELKNWLETKPFRANGNGVSELGYLSSIIYRQALINPNYVMVALPYREGFGLHKSPMDGESNSPVLPMPILLPFENIRFVSDDVFSFSIDRNELGSRYFVCDKTDWYLMEPVLGQDKKMTYKKIHWYKHDTGQCMLNFLPGDHQTSWDGSYEYFQSFIAHFFEIAEEAKQAFSDEKVVRTRASYPITVMKASVCYDCKGDIKKTKTCKTCHGEGKVHFVGPTGVIIEKDSQGMLNDDVKTDSKDPIRWIEPNLSYPKFAYDTAWDLFDRCEKSLWLDVLNGAGANASEKALLQRRQDYLDTIHHITTSVYKFWEKFLWQCECILNRKSTVLNSRVKPTFIVPDQLVPKFEIELAEEAKNAPQESKLTAKLEYYKSKYKDNPIELKKKRILLCYNPVFTCSMEEITIFLAKDVISSSDVTILKWAPIQIEKMSQDPSFLEMDDADVMLELDKYFESLLGVSDDGEIKEESKLLQTVGGAQSAIAISQAVSEGTMSESAGEKLIQKLFKVTESEARELIDPPNT